MGKWHLIGGARVPYKTMQDSLEMFLAFYSHDSAGVPSWVYLDSQGVRGVGSRVHKIGLPCGALEAVRVLSLTSS